jgi:hypothetical protein
MNEFLVRIRPRPCRMLATEPPQTRGFAIGRPKQAKQFNPLELPDIETPTPRSRGIIGSLLLLPGH